MVWRLLLSALLCIATACAPGSPVHSELVERPASPLPSWTEAIAKSRSVLQRIVEEGQAPGLAVAVAIDGSVVWTEGFGYADLEDRRPATGETRFGLGSISKTLTMAGVMSMVDDGLLELDAPIETWLRDFPHAGRGVTIRRLAAHQSGLADDFAAAHYLSTTHYPTVESAYREIRTERLVSEPGTAFLYGTGLFTIVARAMEVAGGKPYLEIMQERVFGPAGLETVSPNDPRSADRTRTGFYLSREGGGFEKAPPFDPSYKLPGAGFLATARDVARFGVALMEGRIASPSALEEMFRPLPLRDGTPTEYALGLRVGELDGRRILHLPGGGPGISSWLFLHPEDDMVIAILSNVPTGPVGGATHRAIARAFIEARKGDPETRRSH